MNEHGPTTKWNDDKINGVLNYEITLNSIGFDIINDMIIFSLIIFCYFGACM